MSKLKIMPVAIRSVSSKYYLDGRGGEANPLMTNRDPRGDAYLNWNIERLPNGNHVIRSVSSGKYLNGKSLQLDYVGHHDHHHLGNHEHLQWQFIKVNDRDQYAIRSISSGSYLDGRDGQPDPLLSSRNPHGDVYLSWTLEYII
ncbi:uncharacterized protein LOC136081809 [Hydra vulgaris]|uniref:Uncharacterized protein LOC136081809 n=1 Tax=Hydra vulgaris TaxID=6087 RepID=A0ABM4C3E0_HYDVU